MKKKILIFFYLKYPLFIYSLYIFLKGAAAAAKNFQKNTRFCNLAFSTKSANCVLKKVDASRGLCAKI